MPEPTATATRTATAEPTATPSPTAEVTPTPETAWLTGDVWVFPGPEHYVDDVLTFEIPVDNYVGYGTVPGTVSIDGGPAFAWDVEQSFNPVMNVTALSFPNLFEATEAATHTIRLETSLDDGAGLPVSLETTFAVLPAEQRPVQEQQAIWQQVETECCVIHFVSNTAAARDIETLADQLQASAEFVEAQVGALLDDDPYEVALLDIVWGNGAYASGELVASYVDRPSFGLGTEYIETLFRHEATHLAAYDALDWSAQVPSFLAEGIAVYVAGGHYRPEPIPERAAAMVELGYAVPLATLADSFGSLQHELRYLQSAAVVAYLIESYGWDGFRAFVGTELEDERASSSEWLDAAFQRHFDLSLEEMEAAFLAWLAEQEPGEQLEDLRLTVALSNTRRQYQRERAPYQALWAIGELTELENLSTLIREPDAPENVALEAMLVQAQDALAAGEYEEAQALVQAVQAVLDDGSFAHKPAADFLAIAQVLTTQGYETQRIAIQGTRAEVQAIRTQPNLETLVLVRMEGMWQITAASAEE